MVGPGLIEKLLLVLGSVMTPSALFGAWKYLFRDTKLSVIDGAFSKRDSALR